MLLLLKFLVSIYDFFFYIFLYKTNPFWSYSHDSVLHNYSWSLREVFDAFNVLVGTSSRG